MLARRTAFIAAIHDDTVAPLAAYHVGYFGQVGAIGYVKMYVYKTSGTYDSSNCVWEKSSDDGETFSVVAATSNIELTYFDVALYGAANQKYKGSTMMKILELTHGDHGLYRVKAVEGTAFSYSEIFNSETNKII
jgi:hypothetical protein